MAKVRQTKLDQPNIGMKPPTTPEAEQQQCIALAYDLVKRRLIDGSASSQETTHFLKLATDESKLKLEQLKVQNRLIVAKAEAIDADKDRSEIYLKAIDAMRKYTGNGDDDEYQNILGTYNYSHF